MRLSQKCRNEHRLTDSTESDATPKTPVRKDKCLEVVSLRTALKNSY